MTTQDRTLYGCPSWCTFDHDGGPFIEPGGHKRPLAALREDGVDLYVYPSEEPHVTGVAGWP